MGLQRIRIDLMSENSTLWVTTTTILEQLRDPRADGAWSRLVTRFHEPLRAFARRAGVPDADADDVVQEALIEFTRAYADGKYQRDRGRLSAWLFGIVRRCTLRLRQRRAREQARGQALSFDGRDAEPPVDEKSLEDLWNREWERWAWETCLRRVRAEFEPDTLRLFILHVQEGRPPAAAAAELGVSVKAVYNAKHRVLTRLRELRGELDP